ncbi:hypothetical protein TL16_g00669 [Triparma laevis f. inornata]|uniref:Uncharacterized protein n=1 Tax=Triparma laevis f. inornata TaxID=1714386 RepID=A0A9W6ZF88_9STRA|nr:hypothetical protein TL16_g00669 [Triparma laevis f. inornata]
MPAQTFTFCTLSPRLPLLRYDVLPFLLLYSLLYSLFSPQNSEPNSSFNSRSLIFRISYGSGIVLHLFTFLATHWSIRFRRLCHFQKNCNDFTHVLVEDGKKQGEIVEVERRRVEGEIEDFFFEYQKLRFSSPLTSPTTFTQILPPLPPLPVPPSGHTTLHSLTSSSHHHGPNTKNLPLPTFPSLLLTQFLAPFFLFQVLCCMLWSLDEYWYYAVFTLIMLIFFESTVAYQRLKGLERLRYTLKSEAIFMCLRNNKWGRCWGGELVVGDVISITKPTFQNTQASVSPQGSSDINSITVPCDLLLLSGSCVVNEAMLTGESLSQVKSVVEEKGREVDLERDGRGCLWGGCSVVSHKGGEGGVQPPDGGCICYVLRTGFSTHQGQLLRTIAYTQTQSPSNTSTDTFIFISVLLFFACIAAYNVVIQGLEDEDRNRFKLLLHTIIIITSVVPPELPMELSLAVTNSLKSLMEKRVYCTEPFRVPLAGKVDWCCFDKTGTLTSDEMVLKGVVTVTKNGNGELELAEKTSPPTEADLNTTEVLVGCQGLALLPDGKILGDPLERATLEATGWSLKQENSVFNPSTSTTLRVVHRFGFDSKLKRMSCIISDDKLNLKIVSKGAPEKLKEFFDPKTVPKTYDKISMLHMSKGRRVLALATKPLPSTTIIQAKNILRSTLESNLTFSGFIVLTCPIKNDTVKVIEELKGSGCRCVMITGDAVLTAGEVARKVGIVEVSAEQTLELTKDGTQWSDMSPHIAHSSKTSFKHEPNNPSFLPNLISRGYQLCVSALNSAGKFTMMCGDGTNDVGALKQAHVGISLISVPEVESKTRDALNAVEVLKRIEKLEKKLVKAKTKNDETKEADLTKQIAKLKKKSRKMKAAEGSFREQIKKLKEAEEALDSVNLGDASVASPFTYRGTSISCCKSIALQGRCTLVTMLQIYKILGVNCLVTAVTLSRLTIVGVKQGDMQLTVLGLVVAALFFFVSVSKPLQSLSKTRPPSSILCSSALLSIITQFGFHLAFMMIVVSASLPFLDPYDTSTIPDAAFNPTPLNSAVYLLSVCITVNTFSCNYVGTPFTESLRDNKLLSRALMGLFILLVVCVTETFLPLNQMLQLDPFPQWEDRFINSTRAGDVNVCGVGEDVCVEGGGEEGDLILSLVKALGFKGFLFAVMMVDTVCVNLVERAVFRPLLGGD